MDTRIRKFSVSNLSIKAQNLIGYFAVKSLNLGISCYNSRAMDNLRAALGQWIKFSSKAVIAFYLLPALILLLLVGTIAQKHMGLFAAHKMFFASFIFFAGPVPLPGGYLILALMTISLLIRFIGYSEWRWTKAGIHLSHLGVLILLGGGVLTALSAHERFMVIAEGTETPFMYDYLAREFVIIHESTQGRSVQKINFRDIEDFENANVPFDIRIIEQCENCQIIRREDSAQDFGGAPLLGMAQFMALEPGAVSLEPEEHINGLTFEVSGAGDQSGIYIAFEGMPNVIEVGNYDLILGKAQTKLPFSLALVDFIKEDYPGTIQAKNYISDVVVKDGGVSWPTRIEMNVPLRYRGYTFFQSSFEETSEGALTVLSVVENKGWLFPYIGTLVIAIGLILHLIIVMRREPQ